MVQDFALRIEDWYARHGRDLPWRHTRDPYLIWISEVILQQTRVAQGMEYYLRFVSRFPTVESLAAAEEVEVLRLWQGLGYYSRARNLLAAARQAVDMGGFPHDYDALRSLRGVGEYTAAAVMSLAFDAPYAVLDGNVYRVLARFTCTDTPIDTTLGHKTFRALADEMLDRRRPALYNQSLMDFGALQCTPSAPDCAACPLADLCMAFASRRVTELPCKQRRPKVRHRYFTYLLLRSAGKILLERRPAGDIWQGLYQFPLVETEGVMTAATLEKLFPDCRLTLLVEELSHQLTHQTIHAALWQLEPQHVADDATRSFSDATRGIFDATRSFWADDTQFSSFPQPRLMERICEKIPHMFGRDE